MNYRQCFICREWSWDVCKVIRSNVNLCLPCYVDVLEVRQGRGVETDPLAPALGEGPDESPAPPDPRQGDLFDA